MFLFPRHSRMFWDKFRDQQAAEALEEVGGHLQEGVAQAKAHISWWSASSSLARAVQGRASEVEEDEVLLAASFW